MQKTKTYRNTRFNGDVLSLVIDKVEAICAEDNGVTYGTLMVEHEDARWSYDTKEEFLSDYRRFFEDANVHIFGKGGDSVDIHMSIEARRAFVAVTGSTRAEIESVYEILEKHAPACQLEAKPADNSKSSRPVVFIGHGRSNAWRDLKDHLQDKHNITIEAYETGTRAGHAVRDILEDMVKKSSFALLVLTGEDEQGNGGLRARQNVIHEAGLFQGKLGFTRAILLIEEGVEPFSNVAGIDYISFSTGNIRDCFGDVIATIKREFPS